MGVRLPEINRSKIIEHMNDFDWSDLDVRLLQLLVAVVEAGSITGAAQSLGGAAIGILVGYALMLAEVLKLDKRFTPAVAAYWQRLQQRPQPRKLLKLQPQLRLLPRKPATARACC